jgi:hypothetical protein
VLDDDVNNNEQNDSTNYLHLTVTIKDDKLLKEQFLHGFTMEDNSRLKADFDFAKKETDLSFYSSFMAINNVRFKNNRLTIKNNNDKLSLQFKVAHLILKDSTSDDKERVGMDSLTINASALQNMLDFGVTWKNTDTTHLDKGNIKGYLFQQDSLTELTFDRAKVYIADTLWSLDQNNKIVLSG